MILCVEGLLGAEGCFPSRGMTWKDGSSDCNELHRESLRFAKFVFAACFQALIGQYTFTKGCIHSVLVYS